MARGAARRRAGEGEARIEITAPPVFHGSDPATWSPEDFFVAAAASCLAVTFTGLASRAGLAYTNLTVDGEGVAGRRADGRFGFTRLSLRLEVETDPTDETQARWLAEQGGGDVPRLRLARPTRRDRDRAQATFDAVISPPRVQLYTAQFCAYCDRARALLERRRIAFEEIDLGSDPERCCELEALTGGRSVPQLVADGRPIGGFDELAALDRTGRLREWTNAEWTATSSRNR